MKNKILTILLWILILLSLLVMLFNIKHKLVIIKGSSMQPTLYQNDILLCNKRPKNIQIGDVIGYRLDGVNIIHRVVEVNEYNGYKYYILKGDNNDGVDFMPITKENIYCKVVEKMLKIKDGVDLKELEKFGFNYLNKVYHPQKKYCYFISATVKQNGIMIYNDRIIRNVGADSILRETNDIIYYLIKADLVEKVSDGNEHNGS